MVIQKCDKCEIGIMERNGNIILTSEPPLYPHKCNNCGHEEAYAVIYPYQNIEYETP